MKLLVLLAESDPSAWERASAEARDAVFAQHAAFDRAVRERGSVLGGEALAGVGEARTLRPGANADRVVTDGPYAETVEQLGGFYVVDLDSLDTALELSRLLPPGYTVEVRPVIEIEGDEPG